MMDDKTKELYKRAAVALEKHAELEDTDKIAWRAWNLASDSFEFINWTNLSRVDIEAARLLRSCLEKGEPLS